MAWWDCSWRRGWGELEIIKGSIWKRLHYGPFFLPNHWEELTGSPEEGPTCSDCQFKAIICLMRPPDMMPGSWTIRAELVLTRTNTTGGVEHHSDWSTSQKQTTCGARHWAVSWNLRDNYSDSEGTLDWDLI